MYETAPKEVIEARPGAIRFAKELGELCNKKWKNGGQMAGVMASLVFQNIVTSIAVSIYEPSDPKGEELIRNIYDAALKDAVVRWHANDLRHYFGKKKKDS